MNEIKSIESQLEKTCIILQNRLENIHKALFELKDLTIILLNLTSSNEELINSWLINEGFKKDTDYLFNSNHRENSQGNSIIPSTLAYHWPAQLESNADLRFMFYALRDIAPILERIKEGLGDISIIYFQDTQNSACLAFPFFDMKETIPADFNWNEYISCISVNKKNNPKGDIKWSLPNVDYAGEGMISIASIPIYIDTKQVGVWSIDVPHSAILQNSIIDTYVPTQKNFITTYDGLIVSHTDITANKEHNEKGNVIHKTIYNLGDFFNKIDLKELITKKKGVLEVCNKQGDKLYIVYQILENIKWIVFATFPKESMLESTRIKISEAFETMKTSKGPLKIALDVGQEMQMLVNSYNDMVEVLAFHQEEKDRALKDKFEAQRILNDELEEKVNQRTKELQELNLKLTELANTDPLTGIYNRRAFFLLTMNFLDISKRDKITSSILMIDIDNFKRFNDTFGHDIGDKVLDVFSQLTKSVLRESDLFARYGGEEFVIFLPNTTREGSVILAEKIRKRIDKNEAEIPHFTVSIGCSEIQGYNLEAGIKCADSALYRAKDAGRNCVSQ